MDALHRRWATMRRPPLPWELDVVVPFLLRELTGYMALPTTTESAHETRVVLALLSPGTTVDDLDRFVVPGEARPVVAAGMRAPTREIVLRYAGRPWYVAMLVFVPEDRVERARDVLAAELQRYFEPIRLAPCRAPPIVGDDPTEPHMRRRVLLPSGVTWWEMTAPFPNDLPPRTAITPIYHDRETDRAPALELAADLDPTRYDDAVLLQET